MFKRCISILILTCFLGSSIFPPELSAQTIKTSLPLQNVLPLSQSASLKAIKIFPDQPFRFDFLLDPGLTGSNENVLEEETQKLIKYFLASLTVPQGDLWVNLSPHEPDRIIPSALGQTQMGQ